MPLVMCPECRRHVRVEDKDCPFCGARHGVRAPASNAASSRLPRLGRAAIFALGTAAVGCPTPAYGVPPGDTGVADAAADSASEDTGGIAPAYGGPMIDTGPDDAGPDAMDGSTGALYGGAPGG